MAEFALYKISDTDAVLKALCETAAERGMRLELDAGPCERLKVSSSSKGDVQLLNFQMTNSPWKYALGVGRRLQCPWLGFCLQEKSFWDCFAYCGDEDVDLFSTWPEYWQEGAAFEEERRGKPAVLAQMWGVDLVRIERYFRSWEAIGQTPDKPCLNARAYPEDEYAYGQLWQVLDVMKAFGAPPAFAAKAREHCWISDP